MGKAVVLRAWLTFLLATIFFGYAFFQRTAPSAILGDLQREYELDAAGLGALAGAYFYSYAAVQLPAGAVLDRTGPVQLLAVMSAAACGASLVFSQGTSLLALLLGRLLVGACVSVGWISILALVSQERVFDGFRQGLTGFAMTVGLGCGMIGQAPLAVFSKAVGWRMAMGLSSIWPGVCGAGLCVLWATGRRQVRPGKAEEGTSAAAVAATTAAATTAATMDRGPTTRPPPSRRCRLAAVCTNPVNMAACAYSILFFSPLLAFASLWSVPFVSQVGGLPVDEAGVVSSMFLAGCAVGSPLGGALSDYLENTKKRQIMLGCQLLAASAMALILLGVGRFLSAGWAGVCFFVAGFGQGPAQVLMFFIVGENNAPEMKSAAMALVNMAGLASGAVFQPLLGALLDVSWQGAYVNATSLVGGANGTKGTTGQRAWRPENWRVVFGSVFGCVYLFSAGIVVLLFPSEARGTQTSRSRRSRQQRQEEPEDEVDPGGMVAVEVVEL